MAVGGMGAREVRVAIIGDASSLSRAFNKAEDSASGFEKATAKVGRGVDAMSKALGVGALALGAGLAGAAKIGIDSLIEHEKALAQTNAVIKSTGGAANVTAKQITGMADAIEKKTGIDDIAIQKGQNLLLTFTNVRNEAGKGNDIFNQTTSIMADMATAMGSDPQQAAMQLGKALNDPIKGVGALRRVGVAFTEEQKDQIKALVKSGHTMEAQKIILAELAKEFGGSAAAAGQTFAGRMNILKARLEEVAEKLAEKLMPFLMLFLGWVEQHWPQIESAFSTLFDVIGKIGTVIVRVVGPPVKWLFGFMRDHVGVVAALAGAVLGLVVALKAMLILRQVAAAMRLLNLAFLANPVVAIAAGIVALGVALVVAYKKSEAFRDIVNRVGSALRYFLMPIFNAVKAAIEAIGALLQGDLGGFLSKIGEILKNLLEGALKTVFALPAWLIEQILKFGSDIAKNIVDGIGDLAAKIWDVIKTVPEALINLAVGWISGLASIGSSVIGWIVAGVSGLASSIWDKIKAMPAALVDLVGGWFSGLVDIGAKVIDWVVSGVTGLAASIWDRISQMPAALIRLVVGWVSGLADIGGKILVWIRDGIGSLASFLWDHIKEMPIALIRKIGEWAGNLAAFGKKIVDMILDGVVSLPKAILDKMFGGGTGEGPPGINPGATGGGGLPRSVRRAAEVARLEQFYRTHGSPRNTITAAERRRINQQMRVWDANNPMATGGLVTGPTQALIGEAGREAVVPLDNPVGISALSEALQMAGSGRGAAVVNLTFNGVLNAKDAARMLRPELDRLVRLSA